MEQFWESTCWTSVEDFRRLQGQEKSPHSWVGWKKEKKKRGIKIRDQQSWWEAEGEDRFPQSEKPPHGGQIGWDRKGLSGNQRRMQQTVCGRQDKVKTVHLVYTATLHTPAWVVCLLLWKWAGCWKVRFGTWTQGGDSYCLWKDSLKGQE